MDTVVPMPLPSRADSILPPLAAVAFLFALTWIAHFSDYHNLGIFSDDHTFAVPPLTWTWADMSAKTNDLLWSFPEPQGRPLGFWFGYFFAFLGTRLTPGLTGMFVVAWVILSTNAALLYFLLRRTTGGAIPLLAAIFFVLFPADTNRSFLCAGHILQPSLTLMLIAAHVYLWRFPGWWAVVYGLVAATLLTYESGVLPILAIPLLTRPRHKPDEAGSEGTPEDPDRTPLDPGFRADPQTRLRVPAVQRDWLVHSILHWVATIGVMGLLFVARTVKGEPRSVETNSSPLLTLAQIAGAAIIGPDTCIHALQMRSWQGWLDVLRRHKYAKAIFIPAVAMFSMVGWMVLRGHFKKNTRPVDRGGGSSRRPSGTSRADRLHVDPDTAVGFQFGLGVTAVSYVLSFTHFPPYLTEGQSTSTHLAASIGVPVVLAALIQLLAGWGGWVLDSLAEFVTLNSFRPGRYRRARPAVSILLLGWYLATLLMANLDEQESYADLWTQRRQFWTRVLDLCPDLEPGTLILCDGLMLPQETWFMPVVGWGDVFVPAQMFDFPEWYLQKPELQPFHSAAELNPWEKSYTWLDLVHNDGHGHLVWSDPRDRLYAHPAGERLVEGKTILLHVDPHGHIRREGGTITIEGVPFKPLPPVPVEQKPRFPTLPFYTILTGQPPVTHGDRISTEKGLARSLPAK